MILRSRTTWLIVIAGALAISVPAQDYHGRKAWNLQNDKLSVVITPGGGHIASMTLRSGPAAGLNPLWLPPWRSVEPGNWQGGYYGDPPGAPLLSSILGDNICLDFFGAPSKPETDAGIPVHGEAPCLNWKVDKVTGSSLTYSTTLPAAQMHAVRKITLTRGSTAIWIDETVTNLSPLDRPFGWNQHVTLGPPFLREGESFYDLSVSWSKVYPREFSKEERLKRGAEFEWPNAPASKGGEIDLREYPKGKPNSDFTAGLIPANRKWGFFTAVNVKKGLVIGYVWPRKEWPWIANWEENHSRSGKPWLGKAVARGMEFGTTPYPDSRRDMVTMGQLHGTPVYRWISAKATQKISYGAFVAAVPAGTTGVKDVTVDGSRIKVILDGVDKTLSLAITK